MKCPQCTNTMIWQSEFDYEDYGIEGEGIIGTYVCQNDKCNVEDVYIFTPIDATL
jgi:hypothetical protein